jgi:hypothetical protein
LYLVIYFVLSACGRFEPYVIGRTAVKQYAWALKGAVHRQEWCTSFQIIFHSLWVADTYLWHTSDAFLTGKYPAHFEVDTNQMSEKF